MKDLCTRRKRHVQKESVHGRIDTAKAIFSCGRHPKIRHRFRMIFFMGNKNCHEDKKSSKFRTPTSH